MISSLQEGGLQFGYLRSEDIAILIQYFPENVDSVLTAFAHVHGKKIAKVVKIISLKEFDFVRGC